MRVDLRQVMAALIVASAGIGISPGLPVAGAHDVPSAWPYSRLMQRIPGAVVRLPDRRIRVDGDLVICSGEGRPIVREGIRRWKHFTCTQSLVATGRVGRDATFRVHVLTRTRFLITDPRYGPD